MVWEQMRALAHAVARYSLAALASAMRRLLERAEGRPSRARVVRHLRDSIERNRRLGELLAR